jgi:hypothetical protein
MRMRYFGCMVVCAALMVATPVYSVDMTGSELYRRCSAPKHSPAYLYCHVFIADFVEVIVDYEKGTTPCEFVDMTVTKARAMVVNYMRDHPDELDQKAKIVFAHAIYDEHGCYKKP